MSAAELAIIAPTPPPVRTLADVRDTLTRMPDPPTGTSLMVSAINTIARTLGCAPDDLPANPAELRLAMEKVSPAMAGLTNGSWASTRSRLLKALRIAKVRVMSGQRREPLSDEWAALYARIPDDHGNGWKASLGRLISYCSDNDYPPDVVCDRLIERFECDLKATSLRGRPNDIVRGAIRGWNAAVDTISGWPQQRLTLREIKREGYVLPIEAFSVGFQQSLKDYLAFLAIPPLDDDDAPVRGLRPSTLRHREFQLRQIASVLIHTGVPNPELQSVAALATRENVNLVCQFFEQHHGRPDSAQIKGLLTILRPLARYHLKDPALTKWLARRQKVLCKGNTRRVGLTEKNRRRLAVFRDPNQVRDLVLLPFKLLKWAEAGERPANAVVGRGSGKKVKKLQPKDAAILVRAAVAIELELMCPIRLENLAQLDFGKHFVRSRKGRDATIHLFIPGNRTKNGDDIELEIPRQSMALIELYMQKYRNLLIKPECRGRPERFLFPAPDGSAKVGKNLASSVCEVMQRELGIEFNMHLFRHLGCYLFLKQNPGQYDVMRRVLGHKHVETTMRFYAEIEQSEAFRLFDQNVLQLREEAMRPSGRRPTRIR